MDDSLLPDILKKDLQLRVRCTDLRIVVIHLLSLFVSTELFKLKEIINYPCRATIEDAWNIVLSFCYLIHFCLYNNDADSDQ